jgi:hypothetical protein
LIDVIGAALIRLIGVTNAPRRRYAIPEFGRMMKSSGLPLGRSIVIPGVPEGSENVRRPPGVPDVNGFGATPE